MLRKILIFILALEILGFASAVLLHLGIPLLGYSEIYNPSEAAIQGFITVLVAIALIGIILRKKWVWKWAVFTHLFALIGAFFGILATVKNGLPFNYNFFNTFRLVLLLVMIIFLFLPKVKMKLRS